MEYQLSSTQTLRPTLVGYYEEVLVVDRSLVLLGEHALCIQQLVQHQVLPVDFAHFRGKGYCSIIVIVSVFFIDVFRFKALLLDL